MTEESIGRGSPQIRTMRVIPVAGRDSMLLNLSGAHAPYFTETSSSSPTALATPA
jgi:glucarate dehydratase